MHFPHQMCKLCSVVACGLGDLEKLAREIDWQSQLK